jgi:hypothetical protein
MNVIDYIIEDKPTMDDFMKGVKDTFSGWKNISWTTASGLLGGIAPVVITLRLFFKSQKATDERQEDFWDTNTDLLRSKIDEWEKEKERLIKANPAIDLEKEYKRWAKELVSAEEDGISIYNSLAGTLSEFEKISSQSKMYNDENTNSVYNNITSYDDLIKKQEEHIQEINDEIAKKYALSQENIALGTSVNELATNFANMDKTTIDELPASLDGVKTALTGLFEYWETNKETMIKFAGNLSTIDFVGINLLSTLQTIEEFLSETFIETIDEVNGGLARQAEHFADIRDFASELNDELRLMIKLQQDLSRMGGGSGLSTY